MLKPCESWKWYYDKSYKALMLDLGQNMAFRANIPSFMLVDCAQRKSEFTVEDASSFYLFEEKIQMLDLPEARKAELILNCVATRRFHKPMQPRSWFFDSHSKMYQPKDAEFVFFSNQLSKAFFIVVETNQDTSICLSAELQEFRLTESKSLSFCQAIKVMNDRLTKTDINNSQPPYALVV